MRSIYLLRHGETVWNRAKRLQGHKDTPLTLKGVQQARAMGDKLSQVLDGTQPRAFYSSPIGRSHQTATIVADSIKFDTELIVLKKELKEITFGKWDGLNMEEILAGYEAIWRQRREAKWSSAPPDGESYKMASERANDFLVGLAGEYPTIIVAHGSINKVIRGCWRKLKPEEIFQLDEPQNGFYELKPGHKEVFIHV